MSDTDTQFEPGLPHDTGADALLGIFTGHDPDDGDEILLWRVLGALLAFKMEFPDIPRSAVPEALKKESFEAGHWARANRDDLRQKVWEAASRCHMGRITDDDDFSDARMNIGEADSPPFHEAAVAALNEISSIASEGTPHPMQIAYMLDGLATVVCASIISGSWNDIMAACTVREVFAFPGISGDTMPVLHGALDRIQEHAEMQKSAKYG